ncbi:helix-turn-helix domain-containing protein [Bifidobacterium pullorum subsp. saeculare]|nr:helix-turn-helix domain-containing protein [Bifidobacterium pullorum subsp. saeculare]
MGTCYSHLSPDERIRIERLHCEQGLSVRETAGLIGRDLPPRARIDRTWDNGTEASCHQLVDEALGMPAYFADPYSSWQRGTNEAWDEETSRLQSKTTNPSTSVALTS